MSTELGGFEGRLLEELSAIDAARPSAVPPRRRAWLTRPAVIVAAVVGVVAVGGAATAASILLGQHDFVASDGAYPGGPFFIKGLGCGPGAGVQVRLDGAELGSTTAQQTGEFWANLTLPSTVELGRHTVTAACAQPGGQTLTQTFTVTVAEYTPPPLPQPDFAVAGKAVLNGQFVVKGAGCQPGTQVRFSTAGADLGTATAGDDGTYNAILSAAGLGVGEHQVSADCTGQHGSPLHLFSALDVVTPEQAAGTKSPH